MQKDFVPRFTHHPLSTSLLLSFPYFLSANDCSPKCFFSVLSFACFLSNFLMFILSPTYSQCLSYSHHLSLYLPASPYLFISSSLCCWLSWPCCWPALSDFTTLFSLCGTCERSCNNHRSTVMTGNVWCIASSSMRTQDVCVFVCVCLFLHHVCSESNLYEYMHICAYIILRKLQCLQKIGLIKSFN